MSNIPDDQHPVRLCAAFWERNKERVSIEVGDDFMALRGAILDWAEREIDKEEGAAVRERKLKGMVTSLLTLIRPTLDRRTQRTLDEAVEALS